MTAVDIATLGEPDTTEEDIASGWDESSFDVTADAFVAEAGGAVVGYTELYDRGDASLFDVDVYVHPDADQAIAKDLLAAVLQRADVRAKPSATLSTWLPLEDARGPFYAAAGFAPSRKFVRMRHQADSPPPDAAVPAGVTLRPFDRDADAAAVHGVFVDAFAEHVRPMTPSLEKFTEQHLEHPDFKAALWGVAEAEGEVVGAISAFNHGDIGFIRHVGVRASHRGRGIGAALVRRALHVLGRDGQLRVDLGVDIEDDVGAARLYEHLGFRTLQQLELVERRL